MLFSKVKVHKGALDYFRKKARQAAPLEIQAYLAGRVISIDTVEIVKFLYTNNYAMQDTNNVQWYADDYNKFKEEIEAEGLRIIGEIHSHPEWDAVMSKADYNANVTQQSIICGICSILGKKTRVRFWTPTSALPCKITYK